MPFGFACTEGVCPSPLRLAQLLSCAFFAILFLQSGADKIFDRRGNIEWLTAHFARSLVASQVSLMLTIVTASELLAGSLSAVGLFVLALGGKQSLAVAGLALSAVSLLMLFFGQRVAKDYPGSAVLASYFTLAIVALFLFHVGA